MIVSLTWLLGGLFVWWTALTRFNHPRDPLRRSTTTFERYYVTLLAYVLLLLSLFVVIAMTPALATLLLGQSVPTVLHGSPLVLAVALLLIQPASPKFRRVYKVDCAFRRHLHRLARIPTRARALAEELHNPDLLHLTPEDRNVAPLRQASALAPLAFHDSLDTWNLWCRTTWFVHVLKTSMTPLFRDMRESAALRPHYERVIKIYNDLADELPQYVRSPSTLSDADRTRLACRVASLHDRTCELISYRALHCNRERTRHAFFDELRLQVRPRVTRPAAGDDDSLADLLALVGICLAVLMFLALAVVAPLLGLDPARRAAHDLPNLYRIPMIILCLFVAVAIGIVAKSVEGHTTRRRYFTYAIIALVAFAAGVLISGTFRLLAFQDFAVVREALATRWGWNILIVTTAVMTAALTDNRSDSRLRDFLVALAALTTAMFATLLCLQMSEPGRDYTAIPKLIFYGGIVTLVAVIAGAIVPHHLRHKLIKRAAAKHDRLSAHDSLSSPTPPPGHDAAAHRVDSAPLTPTPTDAARSTAPEQVTRILDKLAPDGQLGQVDLGKPAPARDPDAPPSPDPAPGTAPRDDHRPASDDDDSIVRL